MATRNKWLALLGVILLYSCNKPSEYSSPPIIGTAYLISPQIGAIEYTDLWPDTQAEYSTPFKHGLLYLRLRHPRDRTLFDSLKLKHIVIRNVTVLTVVYKGNKRKRQKLGNDLRVYRTDYRPPSQADPIPLASVYLEVLQ